jgi:hypothetical protein
MINILRFLLFILSGELIKGNALVYQFSVY